MFRNMKYSGMSGIHSAIAVSAPLDRTDVAGAATDPNSTPAASSRVMSRSSGIRFVCSTEPRLGAAAAGVVEGVVEGAMLTLPFVVGVGLGGAELTAPSLSS